MEDPEPLAGPHVEAANVALVVAPTYGTASLGMGGPDDDHILHDNRCGMKADVTGDRIHLLIVFELQVDDAAFAERGDALTGLRIERDHLISGRDIDDSSGTTIGPVRQTPT